MRKLSAVLIALAATVTLLAASAPAEAKRDTNWPCEACILAHR